MNKVEQIKAWALDNYVTNYGASVIVECYSDEEINSEFSSLEAAQEFADLLSEQCRDICNA